MIKKQGSSQNEVAWRQPIIQTGNTGAVFYGTGPGLCVPKVNQFGEGIRLQACPAYQSAVNVRLRHERCNIFRLHAPPIKDPDALGRIRAECVLEPFSNKLVYVLGLLRRGRLARPYSPDRLIGQNCRKRHALFMDHMHQGFI